MGIHLHWFYRHRGQPRHRRRGTAGRPGQRVGAPATGHRVPGPIARSAEQLGSRPYCPPPVLVRGRVADHRRADPETTTLKLPGGIPARARSRRPWPPDGATTSAVGGRLLLNVVTGGDADEQRAASVTGASHDDRYARTDEFLSDRAGRVSGTPFDFDRATTGRGREPCPAHSTRYLRCSSVFVAGRAAVAAVASTPTHLGDPRRRGRQAHTVRALAAAEGRQLTYGIRCHVIARDTAEASGGKPTTCSAAHRRDRVGAATVRPVGVGGPAADGRLHGGRRPDSRYRRRTAPWFAVDPAIRPRRCRAPSAAGHDSTGRTVAAPTRSPPG